MSEPLYRRDGETLVPSDLTAGPWSPDAQHGGPPAGLLARALELHRTAPDEDPTALFLSRVTVELMRPVPLTPLRLTTSTLRPGWKVQLIGASLWAGGGPEGGVEVARATGLRLRIIPLELPASAVTVNAAVDAAARPAAGPEQGTPATSSAFAATEGFHSRAVELRFVVGTLTEQGPGTMWGRLLHPIVDDEPVSPVQHAVTIADFGNAVGSVLPMATHTYINADLTVNLHRRPSGGWIGLDSIMRVDASGVGLAAAQLLDLDGPIGRSAQSLLIAAR